MTETKTKAEPTKEKKDSAKQKSYRVCVPGSAIESVVSGTSEKDAVARFVVNTGTTSEEVAVSELKTVKVDKKAVEEILNPKGD